MRYIFFILSALSLTSCMTTQKATDYLKSKGELAQVCADEYPVRDSVIVKDSVTLDTVYVGSDPVFDTVTQTVNDTVIQTVTKTLPAKVITKTQVQVKEVYRENTARVAALNRDVAAATDNLNRANTKITDLQADRDDWKKKARKRQWIIYALILFAFRRQIIGGAGRVLKHWAG